MVSLTDELSQKNEELLRHQEEIAQLLSQIVELQHRVKEVGHLTCCKMSSLSHSFERTRTGLVMQIVYVKEFSGYTIRSLLKKL